jgi:hypothetical protein
MSTTSATPEELLQGSGPLQPAAAVILYNHRTGAIFSTHYFAAVEGVKLPERDELERVTLAHATRDGCDAKTHKMLHVDPATIKRSVGYRVSVAKAALVAVKASRLRLHSLQLGPANRPQDKKRTPKQKR